MQPEEFQQLILAISFALKEEEDYYLSADEVKVLMEGFGNMANIVNNAQVSVIKLEGRLEETEAKLKKASGPKLWRP
jgi:hypothetical protein